MQNPVIHDIPTDTSAGLCDRLLIIQEVTSITRKAKCAIYRDIKKGTFPRPVRIGKRAVAWRESSINEWMANLEQTQAV